MRKTIVWSVVCTILACALISCGGGGGDDPVSPNNASTYSISGAVTLSGTGLQGVTMTLGSSNTTTTDASGNYSFSGLANGNYTVTPSMSGYLFDPTNNTPTLNGANITAVSFTAHVDVSGYWDLGTNKWLLSQSGTTISGSYKVCSTSPVPMSGSVSGNNVNLSYTDGGCVNQITATVSGNTMSGTDTTSGTCSGTINFSITKLSTNPCP